MTTAANFAAPPLAFATAETALAAYQVACTTGAADAFASAAHALAAALRAERARRLAPRPGGGSRPRLVVDNVGDPTGQAARNKPKAKAAQSGPDLDAAVTIPKRAAAVGAFLAVWADGSVTRVQGVTWRGTKPETRWARAYQSANRLRRIRAAREIGPELSEAPGRYVTGAGGMRVDGPDWLELIRVRPMPALVAIYDETSGEAFDAPEGSTFGAGDAGRAREIEARICPPAMPWSRVDVERAGGDMITEGPLSGAYVTPPGPDGIAVRNQGYGYPTPWPLHHRLNRIRDVREAFALAEEAEAPVAVGEPVACLEDIGEQLVTVSAETAAQAHVEEQLARMRTRHAEVHEQARDLARALAVAHGHAWRVRPDKGGGFVTLTRPGAFVRLKADRVTRLHYVVTA